MMNRRFRQALVFSVVLTIGSTFLLRPGNTPDAQIDGIIVVPSTQRSATPTHPLIIRKIGQLKHSEIPLPPTDLSTQSAIDSFKLKQLFPYTHLFDESEGKSMFSCKDSDCTIIGAYRRDVSHQEMEEFMETIQSSHYEELIKKEGFYIHSMQFGLNDNTKKDEFKAYIRVARGI